MLNNEISGADFDQGGDPSGTRRALRDVNLADSYHSAVYDLLDSFYTPCLARANRYDRAVGYFRSSILAVAGIPWIDFVEAGGRIRMLCSLDLEPAVLSKLADGELDAISVLDQKLTEQIEELKAQLSEKRYIDFIATFVRIGALELRVVVPSHERGVYHEKLGLFQDQSGDEVSFVGSANESAAAWRLDGNVESIEVFCSWTRDSDRVERHRNRFEDLWAGRYEDLTVLPMPEASRQVLIALGARSCEQLRGRLGPETQEQARVPLPHQATALRAWKDRGGRGILQHATGSGKTFTAILAIREHLNKRGVAMVLVPSRILLAQWRREILSELPSCQMLLAGAGHTQWRKPQTLEAFTEASGATARVVLAVMHTAATKEFVARVRDGKHLLLVADEVHDLGAPALSMAMRIDAGSRLGLSATPTRYSDPEGTKRLMDYFGGIVPPPYLLEDALRDGRLVPYNYFPSLVELTEDELSEWRQLTSEIRRLAARALDGDESVEQRLVLLRLRRARVLKKAERKASVAVDILSSNFHAGDHWLVYCEDHDQLHDVRSLLNTAGIFPLLYSSHMSDSEQEQSLRYFEDRGGVLLSIRCLDQGVDIPCISHALILASSQNPRQFIQRRGRVLRKSSGKPIANIFDLIAVPPRPWVAQTGALSLAEIGRATQFSAHAFNRSASAFLRRLVVDLGIAPTLLAEEGGKEEDLLHEV